MTRDRDSSRRSATGGKADRILEQALEQELRTATAPPTAACLDAETLAAWTDGGLDAAAMAIAEAHLSSCNRCQAMLGTFVRATPVAAPVADVRGAPLWRWLAPFAAAAAAVTIWMVIPEQQERAQAPPAATEPQRTEPPSAAPRADATRDQALQAPASAVPPPLAPVTSDNRERQMADAVVPKEEAAKSAQESVALAAETMAGAAASAAPPAPAAPPALQRSARFADASLEIVSPDPMSRWRIVPTGVERSEDGGLTWIPVRPPAGEVITGGAAPSRNTVWLIGRAGLVLITVDGFTFARVDLPERVDITSIVAGDARSATVTAADGRTFSTVDSGRNWRLNQAQNR
jgi:hypothetical protein